jgi:hypothetical protein
MLRAMITAILNSADDRSAHQNVVDGIRVLIDCDRVSLVQSAVMGTALTLATSGTTGVDSKSHVSVALRQLASAMNLTMPSETLMQQFTASSGSMVALVIPVRPVRTESRNSESKPDYGMSIIAEWISERPSRESLRSIECSVPFLIDAWQSRTQRAPKSMKAVWWGRGVLLCAVAGFLWFAFSTAEMTIVVSGSLQPTVQRFVFSPADGFIDAVLVSDGQEVAAGDMVAKIQSPQIQLQLNQLDAEIGLVNQKRDGLNITLNQVKPTDEQAAVVGSRLAGEIEELEARRQSLIAQRGLIEREADRLELRSPLHGTVIAWEAGKYLDNRPVKRGDCLFRIASLEGLWQIDATVPDWESGYVSRAFAASEESLRVEAAIATSPQSRLPCKLNHVGNAMIEVDGQQHLALTISPDAKIEDPRVGTSVTISIPCGKFTRWYLWTRSVIDGIHRRFWI